MQLCCLQHWGQELGSAACPHKHNDLSAPLALGSAAFSGIWGPVSLPGEVPAAWLVPVGCRHHLGAWLEPLAVLALAASSPDGRVGPGAPAHAASLVQPARLQGLILRSQLIVLLKHKVGRQVAREPGRALGSEPPVPDAYPTIHPASCRCSWSAPAWACCDAGCG